MHRLIFANQADQEAWLPLADPASLLFRGDKEACKDLGVGFASKKKRCGRACIMSLVGPAVTQVVRCFKAAGYPGGFPEVGQLPTPCNKPLLLDELTWAHNLQQQAGSPWTGS